MTSQGERTQDLDLACTIMFLTCFALLEHSELLRAGERRGVVILIIYNNGDGQGVICLFTGLSIVNSGS